MVTLIHHESRTSAVYIKVGLCSFVLVSKMGKYIHHEGKILYLHTIEVSPLQNYISR